MRFFRLHVTVALLALASPAAAQAPDEKGCELLPQYHALMSAYPTLVESFNAWAKVRLAEKSMSRDDRILWNTFSDANAALSTLLIEILNRLGPNCLPKEINREKIIADARETQELARTKRLPVPPPEPGDGSARLKQGIDAYWEALPDWVKSILGR